MKQRLLPKLLIGYLLFAILGFMVVATYTTEQTLDYMTKKEASDLYKEATLISTDYAVSYYSNNMTLADFEERLNALDSYLNAQIWVLSPSGDILVNSNAKTDLLNLEHIPNFRISDFGNRYYQIGHFYDYFNQDYLSVYAPILVNYKVIGYVFIHHSYADIISYGNHLLNISYMTLVVLLMCAVFLLGCYLFIVILPIQNVARIASAYATGNFDSEVTVHRNDEIGLISASMTYMAHELNTLEDDQKKFVSNVSHDFRSPLTSIKGYVEAMIDGTIPPENQEKYLNIILFETERLNKLTQSLLELNKYGHKGTFLDISPFDINQLIKMTCQTFEGRCIEKHISFNLVLTGQKLFVKADMSKIQQVVHNLIDNALKFSHNDSDITIETTVKNEKVFISVKDHGIGIPKESQSKVFERFYKSDLSRGKDKKGTGLGLSIVKEIIQAHNENINVISTEGVGTEFIFTLPLSQT